MYVYITSYESKESASIPNSDSKSSIITLTVPIILMFIQPMGNHQWLQLRQQHQIRRNKRDALSLRFLLNIPKSIPSSSSSNLTNIWFVLPHHYSVSPPHYMMLSSLLYYRSAGLEGGKIKNKHFQTESECKYSIRRKINGEKGD